MAAAPMMGFYATIQSLKTLNPTFYHPVVKCEIVPSKGLDYISSTHRAAFHLPAQRPVRGPYIHSETTVQPTLIHFPRVIDINYLSAALHSIIHA